MITPHRSTVAVLLGCVSLLGVAGIAGCSSIGPGGTGLAEGRVELLPGTKLPPIMPLPEPAGRSGPDRHVACPPGTYYATLWRPLPPPQVTLPPRGPCADGCWAPLPESAEQRVSPEGPPRPEGPEEIPLPVGTPLQGEPSRPVAPPVEEPLLEDTPGLEPEPLEQIEPPPFDFPGGPGLPDVSDQPISRGNGTKTASFPPPDSQAAAGAGPDRPAGPELQGPADRFDVERVDLILAEDVEPWSSRIVSQSVRGE